MGHTNSTANYNLPQFVGSDKPTWLGDVNGAMSAIDAAIANAASAATDAASVATNAATVAAGAVTTANAASETATAASTAASTATATANTAADTANNAQSTAVLAKGTADDAATAAATADGKADAANSAIGDLTDLDTTDKSSVVNAINEVVAALPSAGGSVSVTADGVKTISALLTELFGLVDLTKVTKDTTLAWTTGGVVVYDHIMLKSATAITFTRTHVGASWSMDAFTLAHVNSTLFDTANGATPVDKSSTVPAADETYTIYY